MNLVETAVGARDIERLIRDEIPGFDPDRDADGFSFDPGLAAEAIEWFSRELVFTKGPRSLLLKPFRLLPWQAAIVANIFGWIDPVTGNRRFKKSLVYVPKKNGKSAFAAGLILYVLDQGGFGTSVYGAACTIKQSANIFAHAREMVAKSPRLSAKMKVYGGYGHNSAKSIRYNEENSEYIAIAADSNSADGIEVSTAVIDELHRFHSPRQHGFIEGAIEGGTAATENPLVIYTTTADEDRESPCNREHQYAQKVRDGVISDPHYLPAIWEASRQDDWTDPEVWKRVNPSYGITVQASYLEHRVKEARERRDLVNHFQRLHLNIVTQADDIWLDLEAWDRCADTAVTAERFKGRECIAGLDLSWTQDMTALVLVFRQEEDYYAIPHFWIPRQQMARREREDRIPYSAWIAAGQIEVSGELQIDYGHIESRILSLAKEFKVRELAVDPWQAKQLNQNLEKAGLQTFDFYQRPANYHPACQELERLILAGRFHHNGNVVLRWNASNCKLRTDPTSGLARPLREKNSPYKIDGTVALLMAIGRHMLLGPPRRSVYEERGLIDPWADPD